MENSLLKEFYEQRIQEGLEASLREDEEYNQAVHIACKKRDKLDNSGLTKKQWQAIDAYLSAFNVLNGEYGRIAYQQGFLDSLHLISELCHLLH